MRTLILTLSIVGAASLSSGEAGAAKVTLETSDKVVLEADWTPPQGAKRGVLLLLHMYGSDRTAWAPLLPAAKAEGLGVLAIDLRGHGGSRRQGKADWGPRVTSRDKKLFAAMYKDVEAGMAFLKKAGWPASKVVLIGASVGCSVALHYLHANPKSSVVAAALLTPGKKYLGVDSVTHVQAWAGRPLLMVAGRDEADAAQVLYRTLKDRTKAAVLKVRDKGVHGTKMFGKVTRIEARLAEWAAIRLGKVVGP